MHTKLRELLDLALANKASDIHLVHGVPPKIRIDGELINAIKSALISNFSDRFGINASF